MNLNQIAIFQDRVQLDANFQFVSSLTAFINAFKNYPKISSISINKIENKLSSAVITVGITANLTQGNKSDE